MTIWFLLIIFIIIVVGVFWLLIKKASCIIKELNEIRFEAIVADSKEELENLQVRLITYVHEKCWHKSHIEHAEKVLAYIKRRL